MQAFQLHFFKLMGPYCGGLATVVAHSKEQAAKFLATVHNENNKRSGPSAYRVEYYDRISSEDWYWEYKRHVQLRDALECGILEIGYHD